VTTHSIPLANDLIAYQADAAPTHSAIAMLGQVGYAERHLSSVWNDPVLATGFAVAAVSLLVVTAWLLRRKSRQGRGAAVVCLVVSVALHLVLILFLPHLRRLGGGSNERSATDDSVGDSELVFAAFDPEASSSTASSGSGDEATMLQPLPLNSLLQKPTESITLQSQPPIESATPETLADNDRPNTKAVASTQPAFPLPQSLSSPIASTNDSKIDDLLADWMVDNPDTPTASTTTETEQPIAAAPVNRATVRVSDVVNSSTTTTISDSVAANVPGLQVNDFANRSGQSKRIALLQTGGDESTEAAVEAALRFLAADQRPDGSWDPATSGAGRETMTLGTDRKSAGRRATTGITGLALLSMLGSGNTHQQGPFADNVRRGLTYLILNQHPNGSLAGHAEVYEANYCHGMAALAMCEAAAMTGDASAIASAAAAVRFTTGMQHPTTGGWRYVAGDPGDLSQLGWQAMVLDAGRAAGVPTTDQSFALTGRFVRSVRGGQHGGLAAYRPGDGPSRTMTAEALATRLLLGEQVPEAELREAEEYLLRQTPGVGRDNYYCWYYASIALHQLQDDAWHTWNREMKSHLIARQTSGGSWPTDSEWGGYGGRIYTTAMAALCLEVYYRHVRRGAVIASQSAQPPNAARDAATIR